MSIDYDQSASTTLDSIRLSCDQACNNELVPILNNSILIVCIICRAVRYFALTNSMRIEGGLIAIATCCGFDLVRLVGHRLQKWKRIVYRWGIDDSHRFCVSWLLEAGRIVGNSCEWRAGELKVKKPFFVIDLQTENVKTATLANNHEFVSLFRYYTNFFCNVQRR